MKTHRRTILEPQTANQLRTPSATYSTKQAVRLARVSRRNAQWWIEQGLVKPRVEACGRGWGGKVRVWLPKDVTLLCLIGELRAKNVSLHALRGMLKTLRELETNYFVTDGKHGEWLESEADVIRWFKECKGGMLVYLPSGVKGAGK